MCIVGTDSYKNKFSIKFDYQMTYIIMIVVDNSPMITTTTRQTNFHGCELLFTLFQIMLMGPKSIKNCADVEM